MKTETKIRLITAFFIILFALGAYNVYMPDRGPIKLVRGEVREVATNVSVGPYPTGDEILLLKDSGFSEIISLMDSTNPVEAELIERERELAAKSGLVYLNFPMGFIDLSGAGNIEQARKVVSHVSGAKGGKVYVHCYLGRHRVGIFEKELKGAAGAKALPTP